LKERKERIEGESVLEKWKKGRGYGQNNHLLPPSLTIQNRGGREADWWKGGGAPAN
jgi:hypothetical protein